MRTRFLLVLAPSICLAASATQTDWSGGNGVHGPVADWGNEFDASASLSWLALPGELHLSSTPTAPVTHTVAGSFIGAVSVHAADVDGDGDMDILGAATGIDDITWWENADGSGTSWVTHTVDGSFVNACSVRAADLDGDGDVDILGAADSDDDITWWENTDGSGTAWVTHTVDGDFDGAVSVHAADIDGDGDLDVLGAAYLANDITWWENTDGSGTSWVTHTIEGNFDYAYSVHAADVDGDGDMDVLGAAIDADDITWWENADGSGTSWVTHTVEGDFDGAIFVCAGDVDGDGDTDILGAAMYADDITWWENADGSGTDWVTHTVEEDFNNATSVHAADVDGDGDLDILGTAYLADDITWWENTDGSGTGWVTHTVEGDFDYAYSVHAADVDGDGDLDVMGAASGDDDITWWEVSEFLDSGELTGSILDVGEAPDWGQATWTGDVPSGTSLEIELRAGNNPGTMGSWVPMENSGDEIPSGFDGMRYIQYRITMTSGDNSASPCLEDIAIDWTPFVGIEEEAGSPAFQLFGACPNPATGRVSIGFSVTAGASVELVVYDLSGRRVAGTEMECAEGSHTFTPDALAAGVYLVHMRAGEFGATRRFVVTE